MGANAQTAVPTFTASQVLTAAQMNQSARTGVPVFASTVTRDAAFGGTGEKTLAEGQMCYVEGTGLQSYNGSSWVTWGTAPTGGGLVRISGLTTFSSSSSVTLDSVFSSTYETYLIVVRYITSSTGALSLRLRASASSAATNYNLQFLTGTSSTASAARFTSQTSLEIGANTNGTFYSSVLITLNGPNLAEATSIMAHNSNSGGAYTSPFTNIYYGNHSTATAYDGFELFPGSGTTTGNYTVYGYAKS